MFFLLFFATIKYLSDFALLLFNKQQKRLIAESFFNRLAVMQLLWIFRVFRIGASAIV